MAAEIICDACGKREPMISYLNESGWRKPADWFQRKDENGIQDCCCRECIGKLAGRTGTVYPIFG